MKEILLECYGRLEWVKNLFVKHKTRGNIYKVLEVVENATNKNDGQLLVLYIDVATGKTWVRELNEFCDGRFEMIEERKE